MSIESIASALGSGTGSSGVSGLAEAYRQSVLGGAGLQGAGLDGLASGTDAATAAQSVRGTDFAGMLGNSLSTLEGLDDDASVKAVKAATGDLSDVHDYTIAATQVQVATELTTTIRNKALEAFNDIMRMPL